MGVCKTIWSYLTFNWKKLLGYLSNLLGPQESEIRIWEKQILCCDHNSGGHHTQRMHNPSQWDTGKLGSQSLNGPYTEHFDSVNVWAWGFHKRSVPGPSSVWQDGDRETVFCPLKENVIRFPGAKWRLMAQSERREHVSLMNCRQTEYLTQTLMSESKVMKKSLKKSSKPVIWERDCMGKTSHGVGSPVPSSAEAPRLGDITRQWYSV